MRVRLHVGLFLVPLYDEIVDAINTAKQNFHSIWFIY